MPQFFFEKLKVTHAVARRLSVKENTKIFNFCNLFCALKMRKTLFSFIEKIFPLGIQQICSPAAGCTTKFAEGKIKIFSWWFGSTVSCKSQFRISPP